MSERDPSPLQPFGKIAFRPLRPGIDPTAIVEDPGSLPADVQIGCYSIVRGSVTVGRNFRLGSLSSVEGDVQIGDDVTIRGKCEIPNSRIGNRVDIYSGVKFYDTPNPPAGPNLPPVIEDDVIICCDSAILGGVTVGARSFIGARCFVVASIAPDTRHTLRPQRGAIALHSPAHD